MKGIFPSVVIAEYKLYLLGERIGWGTTEFLSVVKRQIVNVSRMG